jgi:hypothetical protein
MKPEFSFCEFSNLQRKITGKKKPPLGGFFCGETYFYFTIETCLVVVAPSVVTVIIYAPAL